MHIRCERCSTLYELDDALLAPEGSQVQCSRCEHVFTARPATQGAAPVTSGTPAAARPSPTPPPAALTPPPAALTPPPAAPTPVPAPQGSRAPASEPRAARSAQPSVYRPPASAPSVRANPVLRRDAVGAFEARIRRAARVRWIIPIAAAALVLLGGAGFLVVRLRIHPTTARARTDALALVALDDADSLDRAADRLEDALKRAPKTRALGADRVLAQVLRASALADERDALAAQVAERKAERERLARDARGSEDAPAPDDRAVQALERDARAADEHAQALAHAAQDSLSKLERELGEEPAVRRARAVQDALAGDRERALREVAKAHAAHAADAWVDLAEAAAIARGADAVAAERALAKVTVAHPELLRARYLLARAQAALGRRGDARTTLDALLAANAKHEGGRRLRDAISAAPAVAAAPDVAPPTAGPDGNGAPPQRKPIAPRAAPAGSRPTVGGRPETADAKLPAANDSVQPAAPLPVASPAPARSRGAGALAPAALPDPAPASGAPEVAPPEFDSGPARPALEPRATEDDAIRGG